MDDSPFVAEVRQILGRYLSRRLVDQSIEVGCTAVGATPASLDEERHAEFVEQITAGARVFADPGELPMLWNELAGLFALGEALTEGPSPGSSTKINIRRLDLDVRQVLVVDDSEISRRVISAMLKLLGVRPHLAHTDEIHGALRSDEFDAIFVDCGRVEGFETARTIRKLEAELGRRSRLLAVIRDTDDETMARARAMGMDGALARPVSRAALRGVLEDD